MLKYFHGAPLKIYLHEYLTHEYFHTRKFPDLRYAVVNPWFIYTCILYKVAFYLKQFVFPDIWSNV